MAIAREEDIDNEILIKEMEIRPALYNKAVPEYSDMNVKRKLWDEICLKLFSNWELLTQDRKEKIGWEVQKRWRNLRACFSRELRLQKAYKSMYGAPKRRKYIYFDKLWYLQNTIEAQDTSDNARIIENGENEDFFSSEDPNALLRSTQASNQLETYEEPLLESLKQEIEDSNDFQHSLCNQEVDADTNFALSIVPKLRSLPLEKKMDAQIAILNILKQYCHSSSNSGSSSQYSGSAIFENLTSQVQNHNETNRTINSFDRQQFKNLCQILRTTSDMINIYSSQM